MTRKSLTSVIVPVHNRAAFIEAAVESVLGQTCTNLELIVVDDGSTDDTRGRLEKYRSDPRVRVIEQENRGAYPARNAALKIAQGDFIAFLDSDDRWRPTSLDARLALFSERNVGLVYGNGLILDESGTGRAPASFFEHTRPRKGDVFRSLLRWNFIPTSSVIARRECFDRTGPFLEIPLAADYHKWLQISLSWRVDYVNEVAFDYVYHDAGISRDRSRSWRMIDALLEDIEASRPGIRHLDAIRQQRARIRFWLSLSLMQTAVREARSGLSFGQGTESVRALVDVLTEAASIMLRRLFRKTHRRGGLG